MGERGLAASPGDYDTPRLIQHRMVKKKSSFVGRIKVRKGVESWRGDLDHT